ncbi:MAG TPA: DUF4199 domain-containing protein [Aequorivita sp.]|nr:DUF4199 domain-containing protein [Aequorivita sp.]
METQSPSIQKIALNYGVLLGLFTIVLQVISYALDAHIDRPWWLTFGQLLISIAIIVLGLKAFKNENNSYLTFGQSIKTGLAISLIAGIISIIFNYIFITYIDPDFIQKTMDFTREEMAKNPNLTEEQINMSMEMSAKFMTPWIMSAFAIIGTMFFGFIISVIAGLALRKNPPQQF